MNKTFEVKTYILNCSALENAELFEMYYNLIGENRRKKINAFRFERDKRLSLGAGILLMKTLGDYSEDDFTLGKYEKPYIKNCPLCFNLSHSGEYAAIAVSELEVGCDIEEIRPIELSVAKRYFFASEYEAIENEKDEEKKRELFFRLWTLKESFMKATGFGMNLGLNEFEIGFENGAPFVNHSVDKTEYSLFEYEIKPPYRLAVCAKGKAEFNDITEIDLTQ